MTIPFERARAVRQTEKFLMELTDRKQTPGVPQRYRDMARHLLRHYPTLSDLETTNQGWYNDKIRAFIECPFATKDDLFGELK